MTGSVKKAALSAVGRSRGKTVRRLACLALAAAVPAMATPAAAQGTGGTGVLDAVGGIPVQPGEPIAVVAGEFTDVNSRLQEVVERAVAARGFTVARDAPLILSFDTEMSNAADDVGNTAGGDIVGSGEPGADPSPYAEAPWQDGGGELGREQVDPGEGQFSMPFGGHGTGGGGSSHALSFTLGHDGRPPVWQGSVTATLSTRDPFEAARRMVPVLVDAIGDTVRGRRVAID